MRLEQLPAPLVQVRERQRRRAAGRDRLANRAGRPHEVAGRRGEAQELVLEAGARARERQRLAQPRERALLIARARVRAGRGVLEDAGALAGIRRPGQPQRDEIQQQLPAVGQSGGGSGGQASRGLGPDRRVGEQRLQAGARRFLARGHVERTAVPFDGAGRVAELQAVRVGEARQPVGVVAAVDVRVA